MNMIDELLNFLATGDSSGLITGETAISDRDLRVVVINILAWLKLEHKRTLWIAEGRPTCLKSMELDMQYDWCANLYKLVETEKGFHDWFSIKDGKLDFSEKVSQQDRAAAREKAYQNYNPPRHIFRRSREFWKT